MANPLFFPGKYFFYPIGNTPAVSLLRDIAPEEPAKVLLLGCGDPRNILYSIFCENPPIDRLLDFTCCDIDPAVLARNVLLLTMVADNELKGNTIWNIFFHFYLDKDSLEHLESQCNKLLQIGESLAKWENSVYAPFIKMGTEYTFTELRRHWSLYAGMHSLPAQRKKAIQASFAKITQSMKDSSAVSAARTAGPLMYIALRVLAQEFAAYSKTGTTFSNPKDISAAVLPNPTFAYSLAGEGCNVHYGTDPIGPFHMANVFSDRGDAVSVAHVVEAAKTQFGDWCTTFHAAVASPNKVLVIRCVVSEALALCKALNAFNATKAVDTEIPVSQWKTQLIQFNPGEYSNGATAFNVIDSSNLSDHLGLLNLLIATVPLLRSPASGSGVLYTENLLSNSSDVAKDFADRLYGDITTMGVLLGVTPTDYFSGFSSRSNTHELLLHQAMGTTGRNQRPQFHQPIAWKVPVSGDPSVWFGEVHPLPPTWDGQQLATLLYRIYYQLFEQEDSMNFWKRNMNNIVGAFAASNVVHFMRESFVLFVKLVRERFQINDALWREVMEQFVRLKEADQSLPMDSVNYQDLAAQLHLHNVHTADFLHLTKKTGPFAAWDSVPLLVRVVLVVPRDKFDVLHSFTEEIGTPVLRCDTRGKWSHNLFSSVHAAFGTVTSVGTKTRPRLLFKEDQDGWKGSSPVVVSFVMSAGLLTLEPAENTRICFSVRATPAAVQHIIRRLGMEQSIFSANLLDERHVHVVPQDPFPAPQKDIFRQGPTRNQVSQIGRSDAVVLELDRECKLVSGLRSVVHVEDTNAKAAFSSPGVIPAVSQVSPFAMELAIGGRIQTVIYPVPIIGSQRKLKLARKSSYIEIIVPPSGPFKEGGMKTNLFSVIGKNGELHPWNIHRINLTRSPLLTVKTMRQKEWFNIHLTTMMSRREFALKDANSDDDALMSVKDSLTSIFINSCGSQGGRIEKVFYLQETNSVNSDTLLFVNELRFDLASHTVLCDAYVLPTTDQVIAKIKMPLAKAMESNMVAGIPVSKLEMRAWKQLLPALAERCRSWKHKETCEYKVQGKVPLSLDMECDPLCSCGKGKDVEGMQRIVQWRPLAPFVVRIALSPLFAVSYLEKVGRDIDLNAATASEGRCALCKGEGKPKLLKCSRCSKVSYCSKECQVKDWKAHKPNCK